MNSRRNFKYIWILIPLILALMLTACSKECEHQWEEASCTTPKTCTKCGITVGGLAPHSWGDATCLSPKPCLVCGQLEGAELNHRWREDCLICELCGFDARPADERFPESLALGLENGWEKTDAQTGDKAVPKEIWREIFLKEQELLTPYLQEEFENEELKMWADSYIQNLDTSLVKLDEYFDTVLWYNEYTYSVYLDRSLALYKMNEITPIPVSEEYRENLKAALSDGEAVNQISVIFEQLRFHNINTVEGEETHEAFATNTSSVTFKTLTLEVNLLDENGNIIVTETFNKKNWKPGEKEVFKFKTTEKYHDMEVKFATWTTNEQ